MALDRDARRRRGVEGRDQIVDPRRAAELLLFQPQAQLFERARDLAPPDFTETRNREMSPVYSIRLSGAF